MGEVSVYVNGESENRSGRVEIELDFADAEVLSALLGRTFNGPDDGPRGVAGAIYGALYDVGVRPSSGVAFARYDADGRGVRSYSALVTVWDPAKGRPEWVADDEEYF